jgi:hypothetical protein
MWLSRLWWRIWIMLNWTVVDTALPLVESGVANLKARNAALEATADPTAQTKIDALGQRLETLASGLAAIPDPGQPA